MDKKTLKAFKRISDFQPGPERLLEILEKSSKKKMTKKEMDHIIKMVKRIERFMK